MNKRKPTGFVAYCQCGAVVGAMDYTRTDRKDAGKLLGEWLAEGCAIAPRFDHKWSETIEACRCAETEEPVNFNFSITGIKEAFEILSLTPPENVRTANSVDLNNRIVGTFCNICRQTICQCKKINEQFEIIRGITADNHFNKEPRPFYVSNFRKILQLHDNTEISFGRMVELLNETAREFYTRHGEKQPEPLTIQKCVDDHIWQFGGSTTGYNRCVKCGLEIN